MTGTPTTRCVWCEAPLRGASAREPVAGVRRCGACGSATTDPWPDDVTLDAAYAEWYRPDGGRFSFVGDAVLRRTRGRLAVRIADVAPPGPVLDIGSGDGALVDALRAVGREAVGVERVDSDAASEPMSVADGRFAAIVLWHSLEHLRHPGRTLAAAADKLLPGGVVFVAIPNYASLQARLFGSAWFALDLPRHLVHLPAAALIDRLRSLGLTIERTSHVRGGQVVFGWLVGFVGLLPGDLRLYDAIRRPPARERPMGRLTRAASLAAGVAVLPAALVAAGIEVALRRGGSVYVEARRSAT